MSKKISEVNLPDINPIESITINKDEDATSTVSIQELKEMQEGNNPKRSKRRQKSDKSTISLDI